MILSKGLTRLGGVVALVALLLSAGIASAPAVQAQSLGQAVIYGPANEGDVIQVSVNGEYCKDATVSATDAYDSGFGYFVTIDANDNCGASDGAEITFVVNGEAADESVSWSAGPVRDLALTTMGMGDGDGDGDGDGMGDGDGDGDGMGDGDGDGDGMGDGDGDGDGMDIEAPDTGNAGLAAASSSSHALALGLGALALVMLAGARSVTGRSR